MRAFTASHLPRRQAGRARSSLFLRSLTLVISATTVAACSDDGNVLGSDGTAGNAAQMGGSAGSGQSGSATTAGKGGTMGSGGTTASAGLGGTIGGAAGTSGSASGCATSECFRANVCLDECGGKVVYTGCCACAPPLVEELTCSTGSGGEAGEGGASGSDCVGMTCASGESCVAYRTVGGAIVEPDTNNQCKTGWHLEGTLCGPDPGYTCTALLNCPAPAATCSCPAGSKCAQSNICKLPGTAPWLDPSAVLLCEQQVP